MWELDSSALHSQQWWGWARGGASTEHRAQMTGCVERGDPVRLKFRNSCFCNVARWDDAAILLLCLFEMQIIIASALNSLMRRPRVARRERGVRLGQGVMGLSAHCQPWIRPGKGRLRQKLTSSDEVGRTSAIRYFISSGAIEAFILHVISMT